MSGPPVVHAGLGTDRTGRRWLRERGPAGGEVSVAREVGGADLEVSGTCTSTLATRTGTECHSRRSVARVEPAELFEGGVLA